MTFSFEARGAGGENFLSSRSSDGYSKISS
jgi:hypothetical protein